MGWWLFDMIENESKYQRWHDAITAKALARDPASAGYVERHHIRPRCLGGSNAQENLVYLTPEEHYVVHQLLVKIYPGNKKLIHAVVIMSGNSLSGRRNNKLYGWLKRAHAESMRGNTHTLGMRWTNNPKHGAAISKTRKERYPHGAFTPEGLAKLKAINTGKLFSDETRAKQSVSGTRRHKENPFSDEVRKQIAKKLEGNTNGVGAVHSEESRRSRAEKLKGNTNGAGPHEITDAGRAAMQENGKKPKSASHGAALSKARIKFLKENGAPKHSAETKAKQALARKRWWARRRLAQEKKAA